MCVLAVFTTDMIWEQPKYPLTDKWILKMWYTCTTEYYAAIKKEILQSATTWIRLGDIMLNELSQSQKEKYNKSNLCKYLK